MLTANSFNSDRNQEEKFDTLPKINGRYTKLVTKDKVYYVDSKSIPEPEVKKKDEYGLPYAIYLGEGELRNTTRLFSTNEPVIGQEVNCLKVSLKESPYEDLVDWNEEEVLFLPESVTKHLPIDHKVWLMFKLEEELSFLLKQGLLKEAVDILIAKEMIESCRQAPPTYPVIVKTFCDKDRDLLKYVIENQSISKIEEVILETSFIYTMGAFHVALESVKESLWMSKEKDVRKNLKSSVEELRKEIKVFL